MNSIKQGTQFSDIQSPTVMCHVTAVSVFAMHQIVCVPTAITDKQHKDGSLHPPGYAIDYRTKHVIGEDREHRLKALVMSLKSALPQCDFILEHVGEDQEHIHMEFDPKDDIAFQSAKAKYKLTGVWPKE